MIRLRHNNILSIIFLCYSICNVLLAEDNASIEQWKFDLQILLGFSDDRVDGVMGIDTFNALKKFASDYDLADVVLRGEFEDIERWGFKQYLIKYHVYWLRELENQRIFQDIHDKEYCHENFAAFTAPLFVSDYEIFWRYLKNQSLIDNEHQISNGLWGLVNESNIYAVNTSWTDLGNLEKFKE